MTRDYLDTSHITRVLREADEADPMGKDIHEDGAKQDRGKPDMSLLQDFGKALLAVAQVGTLGAEKYSRGGWQNVPNGIHRYTAAMLRHWVAERYELFDKDLHDRFNVNVLHAAQTAWNALARLELFIREQEEL